MSISCRTLEKIISKAGFKILESWMKNGICIIDFVHPLIEKELKDIDKLAIKHYISSVNYDGKVLSTTIRSKTRFKEVYLDMCCENGEMVCRPHANMEDGIFSVEAHFKVKPIEKFRDLLFQMI